MSSKHSPSKIEMGQEQPQPTMKQRGSHPLSRLILAAGAALVLVAGLHSCNHNSRGHTEPHRPHYKTGNYSHSERLKPMCPQLPALTPSDRLQPLLDSIEQTPGYTDAVLERLSNAVKIQTVSYDNMTNVPPTPGNDPAHAPFLAFHAHLRTAFPLVHARMDLRVINEYSLLYTWKGSDEAVAPMVLMAHIDVVPVLPETVNQWTHEPFSGLIDKKNGLVWGRGSSDTKSTLLGTLEAAERLLGAGYTPKSDVYFAFGHDEEISGYQGARKIAEYMVKELGLTGKIGLLIDEGTSFDEFEGVPMANVAVAEKGYVDVSVTVETKGGHSSVPPKHTGIGLTALLVSALEAHPYPVSIPDSNPILGLVHCYAEHSPKPKKFFKWAVNHLPESRSKLAEKVASISPSFEALLGTTQATDIIFGGLKVNALPEKVTTVINHRIAVDSSLAEVQAHLTSILKPVAIKNGLDFVIHDFISESVGILLSPDSLGTVTVRTNSGVGLEPSPMSPSVGSGERAWNVLEGSIRHVYEAAYDNLIVTPSMMAGNTDTRHYWNLTKNIYRFGPGRGANVHTVNEYVSIDGYLDAIKFYEALIRNWNS
ncbi:hypothetical protein HDU77_005664 [Chytriomyces hyalinus]|nr:hypothetical protein HDU77_005664 [Chytriomyces hyalinus]